MECAAAKEVQVQMGDCLPRRRPMVRHEAKLAQPLTLGDLGGGAHQVAKDLTGARQKVTRR